MSETERKLHAACHPEVLGDLLNKLDTARVVHAHLVMHHSRKARQSSVRVRTQDKDAWMDGLMSVMGYAVPTTHKEIIDLGKIRFEQG